MKAKRKLEMRSEVAWFAEQMERALRRNDSKGGWADCTYHYLLTRLNEECEELRRAVGHRRKAATVAREAADVANFAMMLADNFRQDELDDPPTKRGRNRKA